MRCILHLAVALFILGAVAESAETVAAEPVSYWRDIAPVLKRNCVACHREGQAEGGLSLETPDALKRGGDSGKLFDQSQSAESLIYVRVTDENDIMPPDDNSVGAERLKADELDRLKLWIEQGAVIDERDQEQFGWQAIPETIRSSYTLAISPDDATVAIGHANRVHVSNAATGEVMQRLADQSLPYPGVADYDFVQAIAFSPNGDRIATGGFRTVRIWRKENLANRVQRHWLAIASGPLALRPDGKEAVLVNAIGDVEVWSVEEDVKRRVLLTAVARVTAVNWATPDRVVLGFEDGRVTVLQVADAATVGSIDLADAPVEFASVDANTIVVRTVSGSVKWLQDFAEVDHGAVNALSDVNRLEVVRQPSPSVAIATRGGKVVLVDLQTAALVRTLEHGAAIRSVAAHKTAPQLLSAGIDGVARLWNLTDGKLLRTFVGDPMTNLKHARAQRDSAREASWLTHLESQRDGIKKTLEKEEAALKKVTETRDKAIQALQEQTKKVNDATGVVTATEARIDLAKKRIEAAKAEADSSTTLLAATTNKWQELNAAVAPAEKNAAVAAEAANTAERAVADAMKALADANARLTQATAEAENAKLAATNEKKRVDELNAKVASAKKTVADSTAEVERESKALEAQRKARDAADAEARKRKTEVDKREQALVTSTATRDRAAAQVPSHEETIRKQVSRLGVVKQHVVNAASRQSSQPITAATFDSTGKYVFLAYEDQSLRTFDADSGRATARYSISPGGHLIKLIDTDSGLIALENASTPYQLALTHRWTLERTIGGLDGSVIPDRVTALDFRPDGLTLAIGSGEPSRSGLVLIVSLADGSVLRKFESLHSDTVLAIQFSPDGRKLATGSSDKTIRLVDVQSKTVLGALDGHTHHVMSLAWKLDGRVIASASADKTIKVWDAMTSQQRRTIGGIPDELTAIKFLKDKPEVAVTCANGDVRIYNVDNGQMLRRAVAGEFLFTLGATSDGARLLTGGQSGQIKVWSSADGKLTGTWKE
ncbi:MAG: c-type cytochrome domain-containing protein [Planctomycetota bacterium]